MSLDIDSAINKFKNGNPISKNLNPKTVTLLDKMAITQPPKPAKPADYQAIASIYNTYIRAGNATMVEDEKTEADIKVWVASLSDREGLYVLKNGNQVFGWGVIKKYSDRHGYRYAGETSVFLHPNFLGNGYGPLLKKYLIEEAKRLKYHHLLARIMARNEVSIAYNLKLGYELVGRQKEIGFKDGKWEDVVILQLILS